MSRRDNSAERGNLADLRLRRIADIQKQCLRQPTILCFHRHSRFVPLFSSLQTRFHAKPRSSQRSQSPTTPTPPHLRRGAWRFPALDKEGLGMASPLFS